MLGSIGSVGAGAASWPNQISQPAPASNVASSSRTSGAGRSDMIRTSGNGDLRNLQQFLLSMLDGTDSKPVDAKLLKLIIGLMILMALLGESSNGSGSQSGEQKGVGAMSSEDGSTFSLFASTTTVSYEETTTTIVLGTSENIASAFEGGGADSRGQQLDIQG